MMKYYEVWKFSVMTEKILQTDATEWNNNPKQNKA